MGIPVLSTIASLSASGGSSYIWTPNDSLSNNTINNPIAWPSDSTLYFVQVTDSNSCINYDSVNVYVNTLPNVSAGIICINDGIPISYILGSIPLINFTWNVRN